MIFSQLADSAITHILHEGNRIDVNFDTHREDSIKNAEIEQGVHYRNIVPKHGAKSQDPAMEKVCQQLCQQGQHHKVPRGRVEDTQA